MVAPGGPGMDGVGRSGIAAEGFRLAGAGWSIAALLIALVLQTALEIFDNLDAALAVVSVAALIVLARAPVPAWGARLALAGCGASAGFALWNLPPARIFLGNSGSHAVSLLVSALVFCALAGRGAAEPAMERGQPRHLAVLLPLAWPCIDLATVSVARIRRGGRPWEGGKDHTTHRLARAWGSDRAAAAAILAVAAAGVAAALLLLGEP